MDVPANMCLEVGQLVDTLRQGITADMQVLVRNVVEDMQRWPMCNKNISIVWNKPKTRSPLLFPRIKRHRSEYRLPRKTVKVESSDGCGLAPEINDSIVLTHIPRPNRPRWISHRFIETKVVIARYENLVVVWLRTKPFREVIYLGQRSRPSAIASMY